MLGENKTTEGEQFKGGWNGRAQLLPVVLFESFIQIIGIWLENAGLVMVGVPPRLRGAKVMVAGMGTWISGGMTEFGIKCVN